MTTQSRGSQRRPKQEKEIRTMNNIKRISLMTAIFLTVALVSSAVEAGVIRINGHCRRERKSRTFSRSSGRAFMSMRASRQPTRRLVHSHSFIRPALDFAFRGMPPRRRPGASRLVVGDPANGDSVLTCSISGRNPGSCANGGLRHVEPWYHYRRNGPA